MNMPAKIHLVVVNEGPQIYSPIDNRIISAALHGTPSSGMYLLLKP